MACRQAVASLGSRGLLFIIATLHCILGHALLRANQNGFDKENTHRA